MRTPKILVVGSFVMDLIVSTLKCTQDVRTMGTVKNSNCPKSWVHFNSKQDKSAENLDISTFSADFTNAFCPISRKKSETPITLQAPCGSLNRMRLEVFIY